MIDELVVKPTVTMKNFLGVRFALCIIKALRLARIEHCSGTVITPFLPSVTFFTIHLVKQILRCILLYITYFAFIFFSL